jgi:hypothetical protein
MATTSTSLLLDPQLHSFARAYMWQLLRQGAFVEKATDPLHALAQSLAQAVAETTGDRDRKGRLLSTVAQYLAGGDLSAPPPAEVQALLQRLLPSEPAPSPARSTPASEALAEPQPVAGEPQPVAPPSEPSVGVPQPVAPEPQPVAPPSEPVAAEAHPVAVETKPVAAEAHPVVVETTPVAAEAHPVAGETHPVVPQHATAESPVAGQPPAVVGDSPSVGAPAVDEFVAAPSAPTGADAPREATAMTAADTVPQTAGSAGSPADLAAADGSGGATESRVTPSRKGRKG